MLRSSKQPASAAWYTCPCFPGGGAAVMGLTFKLLRQYRWFPCQQCAPYEPRWSGDGDRHSYMENIVETALFPFTVDYISSKSGSLPRFLLQGLQLKKR